MTLGEREGTGSARPDAAPGAARPDRGPAVFYIVEHDSPHGPSRLRYLSPRVFELTGYGADEFLADPDLDQRVVLEEDRSPRAIAERRHLADGEPLLVEYRVNRRDGSVAWIRDEAARLAADPDGRLFSHGLLIDVTRQKRLEGRLAIQTAVLELVARSAPLPETLEALVGLVDAESEGISTSVLLVEDGALVPATSGRLADPFVQALRAGVPVADGSMTCGTAAARGELVISSDIATDPAWLGYPESLASATGAGYHACWSAPIVSADGTVLGTFAMYGDQARRPHDDEIELATSAARVAAVAVDRFRDQERWQVAEEAAARSEYRLRELLRRVTMAAVILDRDGKIVVANEALVQSTGWTGRLVGRDWFRVFVPEEQRDVEASRFRHGIDTGRMASRFESQILTRSGELREFVWHSSLLRDPDGEVTGVVSIGEDATERLRLEAQLRESQKQEAIGRLAGGIAHDFNNLLTAITGYADLLLDELADDAGHSSELLEIRKAAERATKLTRQLLAFARRQPLETRVVDLAVVVAEIEPMLRRIIGEDIELTTDLTGAAHVRVDPAQVEQVIVNLAVNARDAMPAGGRLVMEVHTQEERRRADRGTGDAGDQVILRVIDSGHGMNEATRAVAFEPFFTTKGPGEGTGLGLSTVYGIVNSSGGHVGLDSSVGGGTRVTIALPRADPDDIPVIERPIAPAVSHGSGTILVVEDEDSVRDLIRTVLQRHGFDVIDAASGDAAIAWASGRTGPLDLLVTDVVMPGANGREVAEHLWMTRPRLPVLYVSGYTADVLRGQLPLPPGQSFLAKPFTPDELVARIDAVLAEGRRTTLAG